MNAAPDMAVLHAGADIVGESPLWDAGRKVVWWVDIAGRAIRSLGLAAGTVTSIQPPFTPGALALDAQGSLIVAGGTGWHRLARDGSFERLAQLPGATSGMRMNDGAVDPAGRFWAGTVPLEPSEIARGRLYRLDGAGVADVIGGLRTQNGTAFSPDGKTFYLADSHMAVSTIWAFDLDIETGTLSNRRVFHRPARGRPDGAAMDAEGCYWFAAINAGLIVRLDPEGREITTVPLRVSRPTNLAFCADDLSTLVITSMATEGEELAGSLFAFEPGVKGWPQPRATSMPAVPAREAGKLKSA